MISHMNIFTTTLGFYIKCFMQKSPRRNFLYEMVLYKSLLHGIFFWKLFVSKYFTWILLCINVSILK